MEKLKQETELKLSKTQLQKVINSHIQEEHGLNAMFGMLINGLMGYVAMEMEEKTYSYPISTFKFDDNFNLNNL